MFVAPDGDDSSVDATIDAPVRTLQRAVDLADPGDVIHLREGRYEGGVTIRDPDITIRSFADEWAVVETPIDDPSFAYTIRFHFTADGGRLQNLEVTGGYYYAVKTESNWDWGVPDDQRQGAANIVIEDSRLHGSGRDVIKITPGGDDIVIRRNEIFNSGLRYNGNAEGIDNVNGDRMIVQDNDIHDIATNGVYFKGGATDVIVERNRISNTGLGGVMVGFYTDIEWFDATANPEYFEAINGVVRNNIITNTVGTGIGLYASQSARVYNNTLVDVAQELQAGILTSRVEHYTGPYTFEVQNNVDPLVVNNIVVTSAESTMNSVYLRHESISGPFTFGNNLYFDRGGDAVFRNRNLDSSAWILTLEQWQAEVGAAGSLVANPQLDASGHLTDASPAINAGRAVDGLQVDFDSDARDGAVDVGADEWTGEAPIDPPPPPPQPEPGEFEFSAATYQVDEDAGVATIEVARVGGADGTATVQVETQDRSALDGSDYLGISTMLEFADGQTSALVQIPIVDDTVHEPGETVGLVLSGATAAGLGSLTGATLTIVDNDPAEQPTISLEHSEITVREDVAQVELKVFRTGDVSANVSATLYLRSSGGGIQPGTSAWPRSDWNGPLETNLRFAPGETEKALIVDIVDNSYAEIDEYFRAFVAYPYGGARLGGVAQTLVRITDNETSVGFGTWRYIADRTSGFAEVEVRRVGDLSDATTVSFSTVQSASIRAGIDFEAQSGTLRFAPGESVKTIRIRLLSGNANASTGWFGLMLEHVTGLGGIRRGWTYVFI